MMLIVMSDRNQSVAGEAINLNFYFPLFLCDLMRATDVYANADDAKRKREKGQKESFIEEDVQCLQLLSLMVGGWYSSVTHVE
mmetsp:Transcript_152/g.197  ORF Transcript_152/g.197 Transcript_152/m.197 type:complete len:83 (-) Transcript_152:67-315(-)